MSVEGVHADIFLLCSFCDSRSAGCVERRPAWLTRGKASPTTHVGATRRRQMPKLQRLSGRPACIILPAMYPCHGWPFLPIPMKTPYRDFSRESTPFELHLGAFMASSFL